MLMFTPPREMTPAMPEQLERGSQLHAGHPDIVAAADAAYERLAPDIHQPEELVHRQMVCGWASELITKQLTIDGYAVVTRGRELDRTDSHRYSVVESSRGDLIVDPTWQQFIPLELWRPYQHQPVVVGTAQEIITTVSAAGVPEKWHDFWTADESVRVSLAVTYVPNSRVM